MHSEICPVCNGKGWVCEDYRVSQPCNKIKTCHACNGKGWIEVHDYQYTWTPYIYTFEFTYDSINSYQGGIK